MCFGNGNLSYLFSREAQLQAAAHTPLFTGKTSYTPRERYPNVYDKMEEARHASAFIGGVKVCQVINISHKVRLNNTAVNDRVD